MTNLSLTISQPTQLKKFLSYVEFANANAEHIGVTLEGVTDDVKRLLGIELAEGHVYVDTHTGGIWCEDMVIAGDAEPIKQMFLDMFKKPVTFHDFNDSVPGFGSNTGLAKLVESGRFKWTKISDLVELKHSVELLQADEEEESIFTYLPEEMPCCPYCSGRVEAPFTDQTIPWRGECSRGHSLLYQLDEESCDSEESSMKTFLVILQVIASQYEKRTKLLVVAKDEDAAVELAFKLEAHNELIEEDDMYYEPDYVFGYSLESVCEIEPQDVAVLSKYMTPLSEKHLEDFN